MTNITRKNLQVSFMVAVVYCALVLIIVYCISDFFKFLDRTRSASGKNVFGYLKQHVKTKEYNRSNLTFLNIGQWFQNPKVKVKNNRTDSLKLLLLYTWQDWFPLTNVNASFENCEFNNCAITTHRSLIKEAEAVIFHLPLNNQVLRKPPIRREDRNINQPWIAMFFESPVHIGLHNLVHDVWSYTFNWSLSYKLDADIIAPYGAIKLRHEPTRKNYSAVFLKKQRMAAWIVSNCHTESKREILVKKLQKNGITVDIFGKCGIGKTENDAMIVNYKFYFAFENSLCDDYITEKFFSRYNYDIILVTYGGANYGNLLPNGTFVNVADFDSVTELAKHLQKLSQDNALYSNVLKEKDKFIALGPHSVRLPYGLCQLCTKLNNLEDNRKIIKSIADIINKSDCVEDSTLVDKFLKLTKTK